VSAQVIPIANQKGGVGKTTTALSLGAALAMHGKRVLIIDLDPHACASIHLAYFPENLEHTAYDLFVEDADTAAIWPKVIQRREGVDFDFVPSHIKLSELEMDLKERDGKGVILKKAIAHIADDYDYILIDCPPLVGVLLVNALVASTLLIIPIQTDFLALHGVRLIFDTVRVLNRVLPQPIKFRALPTMFDRRAGACRRVLNILRKKLKNRMFETVINLDTKFREASAKGKVIYDIAPNSRGAAEYSALAKEILALQAT
jgi:chromosome partitioning protein